MVPKLRHAAMKDAPIRYRMEDYATDMVQRERLAVENDLIGGVCRRHGGPSTCNNEGCTNKEIYGGVCWMHWSSSTIKPIH